MIQLQSVLNVSDNTGAKLVRCIKVLGSSRSRNAKIGDLLVVVVRRIYPVRKKRKKKLRLLKKGVICRAVLIRTKARFSRGHGIFVNFNQNSVVLLDRRNKPLGRRVKGPVLLELC